MLYFVVFVLEKMFKYNRGLQDGYSCRSGSMMSIFFYIMIIIFLIQVHSDLVMVNVELSLQAMVRWPEKYVPVIFDKTL